MKLKWYWLALVVFCSFSVYEASARIFDDLSLIDFEILDIEVIPIESNPKYPFDPADLVKIKIKVTKSEPGFFIASDRMLRLHSIAPGFIGDPAHVDFRGQIMPFKATYEEGLVIRYQGLESYQIFDGCKYFHDSLLDFETRIYTVCYDVLRRLNIDPVNLDDNRKYFLVLMDNIHSNSCPNCRKFSLSTENNEIVFPSQIEIQRPLLQVKNGILPENIVCREELELIFKLSNEKPACVTTQTFLHLIQRGWFGPK